MGGIPFDVGVHDDEGNASELGGVRPRRRSLWALGALAIGFLAAREAQQDGAPGAAIWFAGCQALLAISVLTRGAACRVLLFVATVAFGGGWYTARFDDAPASRLDLLLRPPPEHESPAPIFATVTGTVMEAPQLAAARTGILGAFAQTPSSWVFPLRVDSLDHADAPVTAVGVVRVSVREPSAKPPSGIEVGGRIRVTGRFHTFAPALNPGEPDRRLLALQHGVVGRLVVPDESLLEQVAGPANVVGPWDAFVAWSRARAGRALGLTDESGAAGTGRVLLGAMLLGSREQGIDEVDEAFRRIGLVHLVAISGFNLAVLAWASGLVLRLTGDRGRLESLGIACVIGLYLLIVPAESPILRAGVAVLVFLVTESLGRRYDRLTILGWIACALLLWRPLDLWSLGFQLSFGIVGTLLWLGRRVEGRLFGVPLRGVLSTGVPIGARPGLLVRWGAGAWRIISGAFKTTFSASLLAWGVAAPVILVHTGVFSPWAPLTGLVALPLAVVTLCSGYLALMMGFAWPAAGEALAPVSIWWADLLAGLVMSLDAVPGASMEGPRVSALWGAAAVGAVLYWFARGTWRSRAAWGIAAIVVAWFGVEFHSSSRLTRESVLRVDTLAVGDGTCHLVRSGGDAMLWDCGSSHPGFGLRELPRAVRALGAHRVPVVLVTHANLDHFLCLPDIVEPLGVERVYLTRMFLDNAADHPRGAAAALIRELELRGVALQEIHAGGFFQLGGATCDILSPGAGAIHPDANDTSLVGLFRVPTEKGERRVLFTGDIGPGAIARLTSSFPSLAADVLEVPHHGSAKPEAMSFVERTGAGVVIQSTGPQRVGDHRWDGAKRGREWLVTASRGACRVEIRRDGSVLAGALRDARVRD